ncbi:MAG: DUF3179 domain-containing protein [Phaeovulum sp.]|jgi:hypothetical protein|uniref:DUF3179 domain-containing protein n=1 Tax=Phaeovulum sp. TaxID=2934796 RepID=UPI002730042D|nr:DUF3179 domain-containing protein [Phaeovulum sp.]MDP2063595.1 DUF3179 domain-containing protein [Phaeovulum sp.]
MKTLLAALAAALTLAATAATAQTAPAAWRAEWPATDFSRSSVEFAEILSGGPPKDGIPAIDAPQFQTVAALSTRPADREPVISIEIGGQARAYPVAILMWHEIVNDSFAGTPIAVTYCPLCNSGIVFDRRVGGEATTFGTTGKLRNSDLVMYDRASQSWWQQFEGRAIIGKHMGEELVRLPSRFEPFGEFAARHPDGEVLIASNRFGRSYGANPYEGYDSLRQPFLYDGAYDGPGEPLMRVVAIEGLPDAWSFAYVQAHAPFEVGGFRVEWQAGQASALDTRQISEGRDVGTVTVTRGGQTAIYHVPFAFAFAAFNPGATIFHD